MYVCTYIVVGRGFRPFEKIGAIFNLTMALLERVNDQELSKLKGKSIIITGGAGGIGKSAACLAHGS
jgi:NADPH:quinone reductase-like Zn-dependent oxidoreductase